MNQDGRLGQFIARAMDRHADARGGHTPGSLLGEMLDVARNTPEGRAGRPAAAVGVSAATWNKWLLGARGLPGGSWPSRKSQARLSAAVRSLHRPPGPAPRRAGITADVEWGPTYFNRRAHRTVHLDDLDLDLVLARWERGEDADAAFLQALTDRYGTEIGLTNIDSLEIY